MSGEGDTISVASQEGDTKTVASKEGDTISVATPFEPWKIREADLEAKRSLKNKRDAERVASQRAGAKAEKERVEDEARVIRLAAWKASDAFPVYRTAQTNRLRALKVATAGNHPVAVQLRGKERDIAEWWTSLSTVRIMEGREVHVAELAAMHSRRRRKVYTRSSAQKKWELINRLEAEGGPWARFKKEEQALGEHEPKSG